MPRDTVSERRHRKALRRKPVRMLALMKSGGSGKHKNGPQGNDPLPAPGSQHRQIHEAPGPKKYKWKRDVLKKGQA